ncbi:nitrogen regulation protein N [Sesbania bispinosa]|nr:nitrogen regulation protein N [Sesbania bispinosa]
MNTYSPSLPTNLVDANNIIQELLNVAREVTSCKQYDWLKVAKQLGFTKIQAYMTFMQKVDEAKKMCAPVIAVGGDCEGEGTQESEVTTAKHRPMIQPHNSQK